MSISYMPSTAPEDLKQQSNEIRFYRASGNYGFLSNLYRCTIDFEHKQFRSSEDAYQYGKPKDLAVAEWLISAPLPRLCAMAAHALLSYDIKPNWNTIKMDRMRRVLLAKFSNHSELTEKLLATGEAKLIEESKTDAFWGIGKRGTGKNMLGFILMEIRSELRQVRAGDIQGT